MGSVVAAKVGGNLPLRDVRPHSWTVSPLVSVVCCEFSGIGSNQAPAPGAVHLPRGVRQDLVNQFAGHVLIDLRPDALHAREGIRGILARALATQHPPRDTGEAGRDQQGRDEESAHGVRGSGSRLGALGDSLRNGSGDGGSLRRVALDLEPDAVGALVGQRRKPLFETEVSIFGTVRGFDGRAARKGRTREGESEARFHLGGRWFGFLIHSRSHHAKVATPMASCSHALASATHAEREVRVPAVAPTASTLLVTFTA